MQIRCPHCHNPIELIDDDPSGDRTCESCGSVFNLADNKPEAIIAEEPGSEHAVDQDDFTQTFDVFAETLTSEQQDLGQTLPETRLRPKSSQTSFDTQSVSVRPRGVQPATGVSSSGGAEPTDDLDYLTMQLLGQGGMGTVHLARQVALGRVVALKQIQVRHRQQKSVKDEFLTEAVLTGKLEHPNIVPIYEVGKSAAGDLFYSMKNIKGQDWNDSIGTLSLDENLDILINVSDAIAFAHAEGVIHRDLKPQNIMTGGFGEVLVLDWGLAVLTGADGDVDTSAAGTPAYMAPEMVNPPFTVGPRSDIYLLGAMLFKVLTGTAPHGGKSARDCLEAASKNQIVSPDEERVRKSDPSGELLQVALRAMETQPQDRFQTVPEFQQAIRDFLSHRESLELSSRAQASLESAESSSDYTQYSRAVFGFEEALKLWGGNVPAADGVAAARLAWALCAEAQSDFDLSLSLLNETADGHQEIRARVNVARDERDARQHKIRRLRRVSMATSLAVAVVASVSAVWINTERTRALSARADEATQRGVAERNEQEAQTQRNAAVAARALAESRAEDARIARERADVNATKAEQQSQIARANAETARAQTEVALGALNSVIFDLQSGLKAVPGAASVRKRLLDTALDRLAEISREFARDNTVDYQTAAALISLAKVFLQVGGSQDSPEEPPDTSRLDVARDLSQRALGITRQLAKANPNNASVQRLLGSATSQMGEVSQSSLQFDEALEFYQESLALRRQREKSNPEDTNARRDLSVAIGKLGNLQAALGRHDQAYELYAETYKMQKALAEDDPLNVDRQRDLAICLTKMGGELREKGRSTEALELRRRAHDIHLKLSTADPLNAVLLSDLASSYSGTGWIKISLRMWQEARDDYLRSLAIRRKLADADPTDATAQRHLTSTYHGLGLLTLNEDKWKEALNYYVQGIEVQKRLLALDPGNVNTQDDLVGWYSKAGFACRHGGDLSEAFDYYQLAAELARQLADTRPDDAVAQDALAKRVRELGRVRVLQKRFPEALEYYHQCLAIRRKLTAVNPSDNAAQLKLVDAHRRIGELHSGQEEFSNAQKVFRECLALAQKMAEQTPADSGVQQSIAISWLRLSDLGLKMGDLEEALACGRRELTVRVQMAATDPRNSRTALRVYESHKRLAEISVQAGNLHDAVEFYEKALASRQNLAEMNPDDVKTRYNVMVAHYQLGDVL